MLQVVSHARTCSDITQLRMRTVLRLNNLVNGIDIGLGRGNNNISIRPLPVNNTTIFSAVL